MILALYHRNVAPADQPALNQLIDALRRRGATVVTLAEGDTLPSADLLVSIGGDGTLLSSVQFIPPADPAAFPPVVGINFGHLGFLTSAGKDNVDRLVDDLLGGHYSTESRSLLTLSSSVALPATPYALNEVFVHRSEDSSLMRTRVFVNDQYVATYSGDGVIVATPTGSTAYSLSCGGPILTPDSGCFVITPIGAHTLTLRPIIVPDTARISIFTDADHPRITLGVDSRRATLPGGSSLTLQRAPFLIRLVRAGDQNFFSAIRDKLMWGTEVRP